MSLSPPPPHQHEKAKYQKKKNCQIHEHTERKRSYYDLHPFLKFQIQYLTPGLIRNCFFNRIGQIRWRHWAAEERERKEASTQQPQSTKNDPNNTTFAQNLPQYIYIRSVIWNLQRFWSQNESPGELSRWFQIPKASQVRTAPPSSPSLMHFADSNLHSSQIPQSLPPWQRTSRNSD